MCKMDPERSKKIKKVSPSRQVPLQETDLTLDFEPCFTIPESDDESTIEFENNQLDEKIPSSTSPSVQELFEDLSACSFSCQGLSDPDKSQDVFSNLNDLSCSLAQETEKFDFENSILDNSVETLLAIISSKEECIKKLTFRLAEASREKQDVTRLATNCQEEIEKLKQVSKSSNEQSSNFLKGSLDDFSSTSYLHLPGFQTLNSQSQPSPKYHVNFQRVEMKTAQIETDVSTSFDSFHGCGQRALDESNRGDSPSVPNSRKFLSSQGCNVSVPTCTSGSQTDTAIVYPVGYPPIKKDFSSQTDSCPMLDKFFEAKLDLYKESEESSADPIIILNPEQVPIHSSMIPKMEKIYNDVSRMKQDLLNLKVTLKNGTISHFDSLSKLADRISSYESHLSLSYVDASKQSDLTIEIAAKGSENSVNVKALDTQEGSFQAKNSTVNPKIRKMLDRRHELWSKEEPKLCIVEHRRSPEGSELEHERYQVDNIAFPADSGTLSLVDGKLNSTSTLEPKCIEEVFSSCPSKKSCTSNVEDLELQVQDLKRRLSAKEQYIKELSDEREQEREEFQKNRSELNSELDKLKKQKSKYSSREKQLQYDLKHSEEKILQLSKYMDTLEEKFKNSDEECEAAQTKIQELREIITQLEQRVDLAEGKYERLSEENSKLKELVLENKENCDPLNASQETILIQSDLDYLQELQEQMMKLTKRLEIKLNEFESFSWQGRPDSSCSTSNVGSASTEDLSVRELNCEEDDAYPIKQVESMLLERFRRLDTCFDGFVRFVEVIIKNLSDAEQQIENNKELEKESEQEKVILKQQIKSSWTKISDLENKLDQFRFEPSPQTLTLNDYKARIFELTSELNQQETLVVEKNLQIEDLTNEVFKQKAIIQNYELSSPSSIRNLNPALIRSEKCQKHSAQTEISRERFLKESDISAISNFSPVMKSSLERQKIEAVIQGKRCFDQPTFSPEVMRSKSVHFADEQSSMDSVYRRSFLKEDAVGPENLKEPPQPGKSKSDNQRNEGEGGSKPLSKSLPPTRGDVSTREEKQKEESTPPLPVEASGDSVQSAPVPTATTITTNIELDEDLRPVDVTSTVKHVQLPSSTKDMYVIIDKIEQDGEEIANLDEKDRKSIVNSLMDSIARTSEHLTRTADQTGETIYSVTAISEYEQEGDEEPKYIGARIIDEKGEDITEGQAPEAQDEQNQEDTDYSSKAAGDGQTGISIDGSRSRSSYEFHSSEKFESSENDPQSFLTVKNSDRVLERYSQSSPSLKATHDDIVDNLSSDIRTRSFSEAILSSPADHASPEETEDSVEKLDSESANAYMDQSVNSPLKDAESTEKSASKLEVTTKPSSECDPEDAECRRSLGIPESELGNLDSSIAALPAEGIVQPSYKNQALSTTTVESSNSSPSKYKKQGTANCDHPFWKSFTSGVNLNMEGPPVAASQIHGLSSEGCDPQEMQELLQRLEEHRAKLMQFEMAISKANEVILAKNDEQGLLVQEIRKMCSELKQEKLERNKLNSLNRLYQVELESLRDRLINGPQGWCAGNSTQPPSNDRNHFQDLYFKQKSYRKALCWQKKYLYRVVEGYKDILRNPLKKAQQSLLLHFLYQDIPFYPGALELLEHKPLLFRFRVTAQVVIAISRMKSMSWRWRCTASRVQMCIDDSDYKNASVAARKLPTRPSELFPTAAAGDKKSVQKVQKSKRKTSTCVKLGGNYNFEKSNHPTSHKLPPIRGNPSILHEYMNRFETIQSELGISLSREYK